MPGAHDKVNIATNVYQQKRLVLCTLKELYQSFKEKHPGVDFENSYSLMFNRFHRNHSLVKQRSNYFPKRKIYGQKQFFFRHWACVV